jgi:uncharacterized protein
MRDRIANWALTQYKRWISPLLPPACRYVPSCSEYAAEAVARHGLLRGGTLAAWRLVRCNPFARGGYDPVPGVHASRVKTRSAEELRAAIRHG